MKNVMMMVMMVGSLAAVAADWDDLDQIFGTEAEVQITLGAGMLGLANLMTKNEPEAQAILSGLSDLSIKVYELSDQVDTENLSDWMTDTVRALARNGVEEIVRVTGKDERVHILARVEDTALSELSIMVYEEGDEFVFITLDGLIDLASLPDLADNFDLDLDGLADLSLNL